MQSFHNNLPERNLLRMSIERSEASKVILGGKIPVVPTDGTKGMETDVIAPF